MAPKDIVVDSESTTGSESPARQSSTLQESAPSYVKLAMRNMVKKGGKSLYHFFLSFAGLLALLIGLSYLTRP